MPGLKSHTEWKGSSMLSSCTHLPAFSLLVQHEHTPHTLILLPCIPHGLDALKHEQNQVLLKLFAKCFISITRKTKTKVQLLNRAWWCMAVTPAFGKWWQDQELHSAPQGVPEQPRPATLHCLLTDMWPGLNRTNWSLHTKRMAGVVERWEALPSTSKIRNRH